MILREPTVYLAAAIDHRKGAEFDPFQWMADKLGPLTCFNPKGAFKNANSTSEGDEFVTTVNFNAIKEAGIVVAFIEEGATSFGVPMELMFASLIGKPVILIFDGKPGIYSRKFTSQIVKKDEFTLSKVLELYSNHCDAFAATKHTVVRGLLELNQTPVKTISASFSTKIGPDGVTHNIGEETNE